MINTPPPTLPGATPAPPAALPPVALPLDVQAINAQLQAQLDALRQQLLLTITKAELDATRQLLQISTPQGQITLKIPEKALLNLPGSTQALPLADVLKALPTATPPTLKNIFLQFDKPSAPGQLPPLKILLNPQDFLPTSLSTSSKPDALSALPVQANAANSTGIRTFLTPLPESAVRALGLLAEKPPAASNASATTATQPVNLLGAIKQKVENKISSLLTQFTGQEPATKISAQVPINSGLTHTSTRPVALNPAIPADILLADAPDAVQVRVLGATPKGEAIVRTGAGQIFSLSHTQNAAPGSTLYIKQGALPSGQAAPAAGALEDLNTLLQDVTKILQAADPALAARVSQQLQVSPGPQLGGVLLMLFSVFSGGALTGKPTARNFTLSEAVEKALPDAAKTRLLGLLNSEPASMVRNVVDGVGMEWRGHQLPTPALPGFTGPVWFYVQQHQQDPYQQPQHNSIADAVRQTRFVIDLDLSRFGHTQLEGIAAPKRLDLKVNTGAMMPESMQQELRQTYTKALSGYDLAGALTFSTDTPVDLEGPHSGMQVIS